MVSAKKPKFDKELHLFHLVSKFVLHGRSKNYGKGKRARHVKCLKPFLKEFNEHTTLVEHRRVCYRKSKVVLESLQRIHNSE